MSGATVLAVDGGNSKTDLALVRDDGAVLALARGPRELAAPPRARRARRGHRVAPRRARRDAGLRRRRPVAEVGQLLLAGARPAGEEERRCRTPRPRAAGRARAHVGNDTFAVLRAGTERGWGVAVVCGAGINCVGVAPDGRHARFPALGAITRRLGRRLRRRPRRALGGGPQRGRPRAADGARARRAGALRPGDAGRARRGDPRAAARRPAARRAGAGRLRGRGRRRRRGRDRRPAGGRGRRVRAGRRSSGSSSSGDAVEVVLGGGLLRAEHRHLAAAVERGLATVAPRAEIRLTADPPIVGAALLALDAPGGATARTRAPRPTTASGRSSARRSATRRPGARRGSRARRSRRHGSRRSSGSASDREERGTMAEVRYEQATRPLSRQRRCRRSTRSTSRSPTAS